MFEHIPFFLGKILFGGFFVMYGINHFINLKSLSEYAGFKKIPKPKLATLVTGILLVSGGVGVLFEYHISTALILLIIFLIPTSLLMHNFWICTSPSERQSEKTQFMKNMALAGACLLLFSSL